MKWHRLKNRFVVEVLICWFTLAVCCVFLILRLDYIDVF